MTISQNTNPFNLNFLLTKAINYGLPLEEKEKNNVFALHDIMNWSKTNWPQEQQR